MACRRLRWASAHRRRRCGTTARRMREGRCRKTAPSRNSVRASVAVRMGPTWRRYLSVGAIGCGSRRDAEKPFRITPCMANVFCFSFLFFVLVLDSLRRAPGTGGRAQGAKKHAAAPNVSSMLLPSRSLLAASGRTMNKHPSWRRSTDRDPRQARRPHKTNPCQYGTKAPCPPNKDLALRTSVWRNFRPRTARTVRRRRTPAVTTGTAVRGLSNAGMWRIRRPASAKI